MPSQNYKNHVRYYIPHHFVFYPIVLLLIATAVYKTINTENEWRTVWLFITVILVLITWLSYMLRQHYALTLQNRIVVNETDLRYFKLTGQNFDHIKNRLHFSQIAALRFAPDEEFIPLLQKAMDEKLSAQQIKSSIKNWKADDNRV